MMHFNEVEDAVIEIVQDAGGQYLIPYQIFSRLKKNNPALGKRIEDEYPVEDGKPSMGEGAGIPYSPASFIAQALSYFFKNKIYSELDKRWLDSSDIGIDGIIPGNKEGISIWAWNPRRN